MFSRRKLLALLGLAPVAAVPSAQADIDIPPYVFATDWVAGFSCGYDLILVHTNDVRIFQKWKWVVWDNCGEWGSKKVTRNGVTIELPGMMLMQRPYRYGRRTYESHGPVIERAHAKGKFLPKDWWSYPRT